MTIPETETVLDGVEVNYDEFRENWSGKYKDKFKDVIQDADAETLEYITQICGVDLEDTNHLYQDIFKNRNKCILLYSIYRVVSGKKLAVRDLGEKRGDDVVKETEYRYVLKQLLQGNHDFIYKIEMYSEWSKHSDVYVYEVESQLPSDYRSQLEESIQSIASTLAHRTKSNYYKHNPRDTIEYKEGVLFNISRQTSDQARRDFTGTQRRRNLSAVFFEIIESDNKVRIATSNTNIRNVLRDTLQDELDIYLFDLETSIESDDVNKEVFSDQLTADLDDVSGNRILAAEFKRTNIAPSSPIKLSKKSYGRDIRPLIDSLVPDVTSAEVDDLSKLWLEVDGQPGKINFEQSIEAGFFRLDTNIDTQRDRIKEKFRNDFHDQFGLPPDKKIPLHWVTGDRVAVISSILKDPASYNSKTYPNQDLVSMLAQTGVITVGQATPHSCMECGKRYPNRTDECASCGGELELVAKYNVPKISKVGVREYLKSLFKREGIEYIGKRTERVYQTKYEFLRVHGKSSVVDIHLNTDDVNLTENAVELLKKSLNPVVVVNPGQVKNAALMREAPVSRLDLAEIIDRDLSGDLPKDHITKTVHEVERASQQRIASNAQSAYTELTKARKSPSSSDSSRFEQEIFHIINQVVPTAQQWGDKRGGNISDGFAELFFKTGQGQYREGITYDAKFTNSQKFELDSDETRRLRDYVYRIIRSEEITSSKTDLSHFIIVTNAQDEGSMNVAAKRLNKTQKWDGYPVYMHVEFLLALHIGFNENMETIRNNSNEFQKQLYITLNDGSLYQTELDDYESYISLYGSDVDRLFSRFKENSEVSSLEIDKLREFLESDILP
ncbi:hypothetical protein [Haloarcula sp. CBA1122]|uniref:hypothetical protein n=1 Tax=Haloarcula sp. CBA1122 TaxID=2668069 RepID=UPI00130BE91A|nr:hypothetical protein [Haloarcula sp. CBA1122]MUV49110.1 hypothetical protein [Haloarcula sp. CBA1122]